MLILKKELKFTY